jgi:hypothetical protein
VHDAVTQGKRKRGVTKRGLQVRDGPSLIRTSVSAIPFHHMFEYVLQYATWSCTPTSITKETIKSEAGTHVLADRIAIRDYTKMSLWSGHGDV